MESSSDRELQAELRENEVSSASKFFAPGCRILELGGGNGHQARILAAAGFDVVSIDIPSRHTRSATVFPVKDYDGRNIPFADSSFDGVFSSNVLEHIPDLGNSLSELRRVLKIGGVAVHILPTPVWRFWTTAMHYPWLVRTALAKAAVSRSEPTSVDSVVTPTAQNKSRWGVWRDALTLGFAPHGEFPNALAELHYFRRTVWERAFRANGFEVESHAPMGIFYTGQLIVPALSIRARRGLAHVLGSACHVYVTRASRDTHV